ncbi:HIT family protein [Candidatus Woesearchaeota archaeon]|nr:HIT family protein [Candidatus Woesearchaeota archaeon]
MNDCIFCKIIKKEIPADFIYENDKIVAFLDIHPCNRGHALVVPKEHHSDLLETPDEVLAEIMSRTKKIAPAIVKAVKADGFNTIFNTKPAAGQCVFHTHLHIIPRYKDDGLKHWPEKEFSKDEMENIKKAIISALQ